MPVSVYLDNAATTPVDDRVLGEMLPYFVSRFGNPSARYRLGRDAREAIAQARTNVARLLCREPEGIVFTSSGTESANLAIKGVLWAFAKSSRRPLHIVTSAIEHDAVRLSCEDLIQQCNCRVSVASVDSHGVVDVDEIRKLVKSGACLITVMIANNEVGTLQPVEEISRMALQEGVLFHTDAVQAAPWIDFQASSLKAHLISLSAHKMRGPKGAGALYVDRSVGIFPIVSGGGQEFGLRSGTESVPLIVGMGAAAKYAGQSKQRNSERVRLLRDRLVRGILSSIDGVEFTGHPIDRLPNHASFVFRKVDGGLLVDQLDAVGIQASVGAACRSRKDGGSRVLSALGIPSNLGRGSVRFTLGYNTSEEDIDYVLEQLSPIVAGIRRITPNGSL